MRVLSRDGWRDGYLDYHRAECEYRIRVLAWRIVRRIDDLYFVRPQSARLVYNYLREVGGREVLRKIVSRRNEDVRNEKYISCGIGQILEQGASKEFRTDEIVVFIAPSHPACVERIVLPAALLMHAAPSLDLDSSVEGICHVDDQLPSSECAGWEALMGWSASSGSDLPSHIGRTMTEAVRLIEATDWSTAPRLPVAGDSSARERRSGSAKRHRRARKRAVVLGYGNYAKTIILPNIRPFVDIDAIHEIDPTQIPSGHDLVWSFDTAPAPREDQTYDAWIIAGYHASHAPLAVAALNAGSYAVVEKPLATELSQLATLARAIKRSPRLFAGFHKRYSPMNDWARNDLRYAPGDPVSYHCVIYEVPLPTRHWYRWRSSRSRIVSNGCHWIDHFLFLNEYSAVDAIEVCQARCGTVSCFVTLENGACFTMTLTDEGAPRVGVQEHVELRANGVTVRMTDGMSYHAEDARRVLRRTKIHKYSGFRRMYRAIGQAIASGQYGDSTRSIIAPTQVMLAIEDRLPSVLA